VHLKHTRNPVSRKARIYPKGYIHTFVASTVAAGFNDLTASQHLDESQYDEKSQVIYVAI
jgi:hypothetical protein